MMAHVDNGGVRIHYDVVGRGPPLVLQHGFTQSIEDWHECGYVAALAEAHSLVLIDARGHGLSDKPRDERAYALEQRVTDVVAVMDALGIARADFWGYSMGGFIGFGMARHAPSRLDRLVIGGSHPFARDPEVNRRWLRPALKGGDALVDAIRSHAADLPPGYARRLSGLDVAVLLAATPAGESMEDMLPGLAMPCLVYCGDADPFLEAARACAERIPAGQFVALPGLGHLPAFIDSAAVLPAVTAFLRSR